MSLMLVAAVGTMLVMGACGDDDSDEQASTTTGGPFTTNTEVLAPPSTQPGRATFTAALTGDAEIPGPGDTAGSGSSTINVDTVKGEVCYELTVSGIAPPDKAHIHRGPVDQAGPVVVNLTAPNTGRAEGCTAVEQALAQEIVAGPSGFYVNVHNGPYPAGAVRGQLTI
jgi:hypothetical protein